MVTAQRPPQKDEKLVRERQDRRLQRRRCFFPGQAHVVWPHLWNDARLVPWRPCSVARHLATPLAHPAASPTRETASVRDAPGYRTASARASGGVHWLSSVPTQTASPAHRRWERSGNNNGQTAISPPWLTVSLWHPRQVYAVSGRMRPLWQTSGAGLPGTRQGRRVANGRIGLGTSRFKLAADGRLG